MEMACARLRAPSFAHALRSKVATVAALTLRRTAISLVVSPSAYRRKVSRSSVPSMMPARNHYVPALS